MLRPHATVQKMSFEPTEAVQVADASRRVLPRPISYACAILVAGAAVVFLGTTRAAAADELGGLVGDTVETIATAVAPAAPSDEVVPPIVEAIEPVTGELPPIDTPISPIEPITPIIDELLPIIEPLTPSVDMPIAPVLGPLRLELTLAGVPARAADTATPTQDLAGSATIDPAIGAQTSSTTPARVSADLSFELPVPSSSPLEAGGTMLVAALLIGLLVAAPTGWTVSGVAFGLRPLSLAHSPPVPPG